MHLPPVIEETHSLAYFDAKGFARVMYSRDREELEKALESLIISGKATLVGARFDKVKKPN